MTITNYPNIPASGLGCVTVLIGAYDIESGKPIIGVINQPFHAQNEDGRCVFKVSFLYCDILRLAKYCLLAIVFKLYKL